MDPRTRSVPAKRLGALLIAEDDKLLTGPQCRGTPGSVFVRPRSAVLPPEDDLQNSRLKTFTNLINNDTFATHEVAEAVTVASLRRKRAHPSQLTELIGGH